MQTSVKALILLVLFGVTSTVQSLFADTGRGRPGTHTRSAEIRQKNAPTTKKRTRVSQKKVREKKPPKQVRQHARTTRQDRSESAIHIEGRENVFHGLDKNGNGFISPSEWPAKRRSFDILDTNHDGRISPDELRSRQL